MIVAPAPVSQRKTVETPCTTAPMCGLVKLVDTLLTKLEKIARIEFTKDLFAFFTSLALAIGGVACALLWLR